LVFFARQHTLPEVTSFCACDEPPAVLEPSLDRKPRERPVLIFSA
jgi:hypothetical protein